VRASPLLHILDVLREIPTPPEAIVLENVQNFERSESCAQLLDVLGARGYSWRSFLLSPQQFGFPNARRRFYLVAKRECWTFRSVPETAAKDSRDVCGSWWSLPCSRVRISTMENQQWPDECTVSSETRAVCSSCGQSAPLVVDEQACGCAYKMCPIGDFLQLSADGEKVHEWMISETTMRKESARCLDVVHAACCHSECFTKAYGRYIDGTGSVYRMSRRVAQPSADAGEFTMQDYFGFVRYFSPAEEARLLGFKLEPCKGVCLPRCGHEVATDEVCRCSTFSLPESGKPRELWGLLGNSLNPQVVALVCNACDLVELGKQCAQTPWHA